MCLLYIYIYVTCTGRKTLSCSQLDTVSLSPVFHSCFLKRTNLLSKYHPICVVWTFNPGSTTHIFRPSYAVWKFYFELVVERIHWKEVSSDTWSWKDWIPQRSKTIFHLFSSYIYEMIFGTCVWMKCMLKIINVLTMLLCYGMFWILFNIQNCLQNFIFVCFESE